MRRLGTRRLCAGGFALTMIAAVLTAAGAPARADGNVTLSGITKFAHIAVDHSHVFLSSGSGSSSVLVTSYSGATVANISNEAGADEMALSPDGTALYVALSGADAISVIDTGTLTETTRYATGASTCPHSVAVAASKI